MLIIIFTHPRPVLNSQGYASKNLAEILNTLKHSFYVHMVLAKLNKL